MQVQINGESRDIEPGGSVAALLEGLGLNPKTVAVQRNGEILEKTAFLETLVGDGDAIEIVRFVGGG